MTREESSAVTRRREDANVFGHHVRGTPENRQTVDRPRHVRYHRLPDAAVVAAIVSEGLTAAFRHSLIHERLQKESSGVTIGPDDQYSFQGVTGRDHPDETKSPPKKLFSLLAFIFSYSYGP